MINFERGFRRTTWVLSSCLALVVFVFVASDWPLESDDWRNAGEPEPDWQTSVNTYVLYDSKYYKFTMTSDFQDWSTLQISKSYPEGATDIIKNHIDHDVAYMTRNKLWNEIEKTSILKTDQNKVGQTPLTAAGPADEISFIYIRASQTRSSSVYTRKQILRAEALGKLAPEEKELLAHMREKDAFPSPISVRRYAVISLLSFFGTVIASSAIAFSIPWIVFFLLRWVFWGFKDDSKV
jgi:hypothetical protein